MKLFVITLLMISVQANAAIESCIIRDRAKARIESSHFDSIYNGIRDDYTIECSDNKTYEKLENEKLIRKWFFQGREEIVTFGIKNKIVGLSLVVQELTALRYFQIPAEVRQSAGFCDYKDPYDKMCGAVIQFVKLK